MERKLRELSSMQTSPAGEQQTWDVTLGSLLPSPRFEFPCGGALERVPDGGPAWK